MTPVQHQQVDALPAADKLEAGTLYFVADGADRAKLYVTNTAGTITARMVHDGEVGNTAGGLTAVVHDGTLAGDGTDANPLRVVVSTSSGTGGPVYLSSTQADTTTQGTLDGADTSAASDYLKVTPGANTSVAGLRLRGVAVSQPIRLKIWRVSDGAAIASADVTPDSATSSAPTTATALFASAVTLTAGVAYYIGFHRTGTTSPDIRGYNGNPAAPTLAGFTVDPSGWRSSVSPYSGAPDSTTSLFPQISLVPPSNKNVTGPVDPFDYPVVPNVGYLPNGSVALLDDGTNPPRLVRRRANGSLWYGAPFSSTP